MRIIAGAFKGRVLRTACGPGYRPATGRVREALFSALGSLGVHWEGARVADIFAGSGALGLEALSRGASYAVFVEMAASAARVLQDNVRALGLSSEQAEVARMDARRWAQRASGPYHVVFVDPPYGRGLLVPVIQALPALLASGAVVVAETEASLEIPPVPWKLVRDSLYGQTRIRIWQNE